MKNFSKIERLSVQERVPGCCRSGAPARLPRMAPGIPQLRQSIDQLDRQILELVSERLRLVMQVG